MFLLFFVSLLLSKQQIIIFLTTVQVSNCNGAVGLKQKYMAR